MLLLWNALQEGRQGQTNAGLAAKVWQSTGRYSCIPLVRKESQLEQIEPVQGVQCKACQQKLRRPGIRRDTSVKKEGRKEPTLREQKEKFCAANATDKRGLAVSQVQPTPLLLMQESQVTEDGKGQPESACCTSPQEETLLPQ